MNINCQKYFDLPFFGILEQTWMRGARISMRGDVHTYDSDGYGGLDVCIPAVVA